MRSQFAANPMQTQMPGSLQSPLANQITPQLPVQLPNQMMSQMANNLNPQMNPGGMPGGNQMLGQLGQQYNINVNNQMQQQPPPNALQQMQQNAMGKTSEFFLYQSSDLITDKVLVFVYCQEHCHTTQCKRNSSLLCNNRPGWPQHRPPKLKRNKPKSLTLHHFAE